MNRLLRSQRLVRRPLVNTFWVGLILGRLKVSTAAGKYWWIQCRLEPLAVCLVGGRQQGSLKMTISSSSTATPLQPTYGCRVTLIRRLMNFYFTGTWFGISVFLMSKLSPISAITSGLVPPILVIGVVLGSIYGGITGITEAAGMGAFAVFVIALLRGEASVGLVWDSMMRTLRSTGTIIWVTIGAAALAGAYTLAGGPNYIANLIVGSEMPTMVVLLTMMLILLFMGAFMDWVGIVLLIIPVFLPIVRKLPIEEIGFIGQLEPRHVAIWFGVLFCMNMQVSFL